MAIPLTIVAEVSVNWGSAQEREAKFLGEKFEAVIEHNRQRGYHLVSWQLARTANERTLTRVDGCVVREQEINETIIAVFTRA